MSLTVTVQQEDCAAMNDSRINNLEWVCIRNAKRVLDVFRAKKLPVILIKEVHRPDITVDDVEAEL